MMPYTGPILSGLIFMLLCLAPASAQVHAAQNLRGPAAPVVPSPTVPALDIPKAPSPLDPTVSAAPTPATPIMQGGPAQLSPPPLAAPQTPTHPVIPPLVAPNAPNTPAMAGATKGQAKTQAKPPPAAQPSAQVGTLSTQPSAQPSAQIGTLSTQPVTQPSAQIGTQTGTQLDTQPAAPTAPAGQAQNAAHEAAAAYARGDFFKAQEIWRQAAAAGDIEAMNNLGVLYDKGQGVEPDLGRALFWFAKAAQGGHASGMSNYGRMLDQGRGIAADPVQAARWFDQAARKDQAEAQYNLGLHYEHGRGVARDERAAAAWYSRAAAQQQPDALARLGHFYSQGVGVEKNPARGVLLLYAAAMNGSIAAMKELEELAAQGPPRSAAVLFGQRPDSTDRKNMRAALKKAKIPIERESDDFICDLYNVRAHVPGADQMAVCYGPGPQAPLGFVTIEYAAKDKAAADNLTRMVAGRFGPASSAEGDDATLWNLGTVMVATRFTPEQRRLSLMYMVPKTYHLTQRP